MSRGSHLCLQFIHFLIATLTEYNSIKSPESTNTTWSLSQTQKKTGPIRQET